jgi:hypothetical protein
VGSFFFCLCRAPFSAQWFFLVGAVLIGERGKRVRHITHFADLSLLPASFRRKSCGLPGWRGEAEGFTISYSPFFGCPEVTYVCASVIFLYMYLRGLFYFVRVFGIIEHRISGVESVLASVVA